MLNITLSIILIIVFGLAFFQILETKPNCKKEQTDKYISISIVLILISVFIYLLIIELQKLGVYIRSNFDMIEISFISTYTILFLGLIYYINGVQGITNKVKFLLLSLLIVSVCIGLIIIRMN